MVDDVDAKSRMTEAWAFGRSSVLTASSFSPSFPNSNREVDSEDSDTDVEDTGREMDDFENGMPIQVRTTPDSHSPPQSPPAAGSASRGPPLAIRQPDTVKDAGLRRRVTKFMEEDVPSRLFSDDASVTNQKTLLGTRVSFARKVRTFLVEGVVALFAGVVLLILMLMVRRFNDSTVGTVTLGWQECRQDAQLVDELGPHLFFRKVVRSHAADGAYGQWSNASVWPICTTMFVGGLENGFPCACCFSRTFCFQDLVLEGQSSNVARVVDVMPVGPGNYTIVKRVRNVPVWIDVNYTTGYLGDSSYHWKPVGKQRVRGAEVSQYLRALELLETGKLSGEQLNTTADSADAPSDNDHSEKEESFLQKLTSFYK